MPIPRPSAAWTPGSNWVASGDGRTILGNSGVTAIARKAGLPMWLGLIPDMITSNPIKDAREAALVQLGYERRSTDARGYSTWALPGSGPSLKTTIRLGPWGAVYLGRKGWDQMPRDEREALTNYGRELLVERYTEHVNTKSEARRAGRRQPTHQEVPT